MFTSVIELTEAITVWAEHCNSDPKPFIWKATAEDIITKVARGRETLRRVKSQTHHFPAHSARPGSCSICQCSERMPSKRRTSWPEP